MIDYSKFPNKPIACIDMMSFYASCMASLHNLDIRTASIAVVGNFKQRGQCGISGEPGDEKTIPREDRHSFVRNT